MFKIIKSHKKYLRFVLFIVLLGIVLGIIYYLLLAKDIKSSIILSIKSTSLFKYNFIFKDLISLAIILVLAFLIIGLPLSIIYLLFEGFTISFLISILTSTYGIKGFLYALIYIFINKLIILILKICFIKRIINITRYVIGFILYHEENIKNKLIINFKNSLYILIFILFIDILLYFISPKVLILFKYLVN